MKALTLPHTYKTASIEALFIFSIIAMWFFLPVLCVIPILLILYKVQLKDPTQVFLLFLIALTFGLVAYTTQSVGQSETDIARYYSGYHVLAEVDNFQEFVLQFFIRDGTSLLFQLINLTFAKIFPSNAQLLPLFWVTITYFFTFLTIKEGVFYISGRYSKIYVIIIFFSITGIITFFTVTEIIKQVSSVSIFSYALMLKINNKRGHNFWLIVSVLVHLSSFFIIPVFIFFNKKNTFRFLPYIIFACFCLSFFNFNSILSILFSFLSSSDTGLKTRLEYYEKIETWSISFRFYIIFFIYIFQISLTYVDYYFERVLKLKEKKKVLITLQTLAFLFLLVNRSNVHNFIRYTFCFFPFFALVYMQLFYSKIKKNELLLLTLFLGIFYQFSNVKLLTAQTVINGPYDNSYMNNNLLEIVISNMYNFLSFRVNG